MINRIDADLFNNIIAKPARFRNGALQIEIAGIFYHVKENEDECGMFQGYLLREPSNKYDANAIKICKEDGTLVGYVPKKVNVEIGNMIGTGKVPCTINILGKFRGDEFWGIGGLCLIEKYDKEKAARLIEKNATPKWEDPWDVLRRSNESGNFTIEVRVVDPDNKEQSFCLPKMNTLKKAMAKLDELLATYKSMQEKADEVISDSYDLFLEHKVTGASHDRLVHSMWYVEATFQYKDRIIGDGYMVQKEMLEALYGDLSTLAKRFNKPETKSKQWSWNDSDYSDVDEDDWDEDDYMDDDTGEDYEDLDSSDCMPDNEEDNSSRGSSLHVRNWEEEVENRRVEKKRDITNDGFTLETFEKSIDDDEYYDFRW